jgi:hypothetical protein
MKKRYYADLALWGGSWNLPGLAFLVAILFVIIEFRRLLQAPLMVQNAAR